MKGTKKNGRLSDLVADHLGVLDDPAPAGMSASGMQVLGIRAGRAAALAHRIH